MECRIEVCDQRSVRTVSVAGQLAGAHVPDLLEACGSISPALQVDLTHVVSIDAIALDALHRIRGAGARLVGVPGYIQLKLDSVRLGPREI